MTRIIFILKKNLFMTTPFLMVVWLHFKTSPWLQHFCAVKLLKCFVGLTNVTHGLSRE